MKKRTEAMINAAMFIIAYLLLILVICIATARAQPYSRSNWYHWADEDKDCQSTRVEVLIRDSIIPVVYKSTAECKILFGLWRCKYTNNLYLEASALDIDHIVPLKNAWKSGASSWSREKKRKFANDMDNLIAVQARANRQKSWKGPELWRPDNMEYWKQYAFKWIKIKERYNLSYTCEEFNALFEMMRSDSNGY